jgi:hypothetical protein
LDPPFHDRVHPGHPDATEHDRDAGIGEDLVEHGRVLPVTVADQVLDPTSGVVEIHEQVPGRLGDPRRGRVGGGAEHAYLTGGVLDDGQDVQAGAGQRHGLEEIGSDEGVGLRAQERRPGVAGALGCRVDPSLVEDLPHGRGGDRDTEDEQLAVDSSVSPGAVLAGQA